MVCSICLYQLISKGMSAILTKTDLTEVRTSALPSILPIDSVCSLLVVASFSPSKMVPLVPLVVMISMMVSFLTKASD